MLAHGSLRSPFAFPRFSLTPFAPNRARSEPRYCRAIRCAVTCSGYYSCHLYVVRFRIRRTNRLRRLSSANRTATRVPVWLGRIRTGNEFPRPEFCGNFGLSRLAREKESLSRRRWRRTGRLVLFRRLPSTRPFGLYDHPRQDGPFERSPAASLARWRRSARDRASENRDQYHFSIER